MTTRVTVDAHAGWDVLVWKKVGEPSDEPSYEKEIIPAGTVKDFYIHSGLSLLEISEIKK